MKTSKLTLVVAILGALGYAQAYAFDTPAQSAQSEHEHHGMMNADTNKDGKISHDEFMAASQKRAEEHFNRMDTNNDGFIDQAERKAAFDSMREHRQEWREHHPKPETPKPGAS